MAARRTVKCTLDSYGTFSTPSYSSTGEASSTKLQVDSRNTGKQFTTNNTRKGQTGDNWNRHHGRKTDWNVLYEGEKYVDQHAIEQKCKLEQTKKNLTTRGFQASSPSVKSTGLGDYYGTIGPKFQHEPDYEVLTKEAKPAPSKHEQRQMMTSPMKKGSGLTPGISFGPPPRGSDRPREYRHMTDEYERAQQLERAARKSREQMQASRPPFRGMSRPVDYFDAHNKGAMSSRRAGEEPGPPRSAKGTSESPSRPVTAPFYPSRYPRSGPLATFGSFPRYIEDPFDKKANKVEDEKKNKISGPAFKPTSNPKTMRTTSVLFRHPGVSL